MVGHSVVTDCPVEVERIGTVSTEVVLTEVLREGDLGRENKLLVRE